jgi:hypothetical protein
MNSELVEYINSRIENFGYNGWAAIQNTQFSEELTLRCSCITGYVDSTITVFINLT